MNFYGHAWVAAWFSEREPFILGAMLPDFASALRVATPAAREPELCAGVRLHHATDAVFHRTTAFLALEAEARRALCDAGVSKGARRALAHVGVELLIDERLGREAQGWTAYAGALRYGASGACGDALEWSVEGTRERFAALCRRLEGAASWRGQAVDLAARLVACLAGRPRLELSGAEAAQLAPWLEECRPRVAARMPGLLAEIRSALPAPQRPAAHLGA